MNTFTIDADEYYPVRYKVNDAKTFKNLVAGYIISYLLIIMCILQTGSFNLAFKIILI